MSCSADGVLCLPGILYAGGVFVSAASNWPEEGINFMAKDSKSVFLMTEKPAASYVKQKIIQ